MKFELTRKFKPATRRGRSARWIMQGVLILVAVGSGGLYAAQEAGFSGRVVVQWVADNEFVATIRVVEDFSFSQANGQTWRVPVGAAVDGRSMSPLFVRLSGRPFDSGFRKASLVYDYATKDMSQPWRDAQKMFFEASLAEGVTPAEAKVMYLLLYATGPRWAIRGKSSCFNHCHTAVSELAWRPLVEDEPVAALVGWVRSEDPGLEQIEQRVRKVILHPGPHVFGYVRQQDLPAAGRD
ncbi:MAG: DUF1353 domain-containing protein [Burkholderiales bacterium]